MLSRDYATVQDTVDADEVGEHEYDEEEGDYGVEGDVGADVDQGQKAGYYA